MLVISRVLVILALCSLLMAQDVETSCQAKKSCKACTQCSTTLGCRWCPVDNTCVPSGTNNSMCFEAEYMDETKFCKCKPKRCRVKSGVDASVCSWYTRTTDGPLPSNTRKWFGGDFLPEIYRNTAQCVCAGNDLPLWEIPVAQCVRKQIIRGHLAIRPRIKRMMRAVSSDCTASQQFAPLIFDIHERAYRRCCCSGTIAPIEAWSFLICFGNIFPCSIQGPPETPLPGLLWSVLEDGRCGCGW
mmetsp:Transcript_1130/g.1287  ORF Transcript_1130/g.1287 Transcript_1130/m.1287 type:complete len:244 (+) Transcript_1130:28-759(+)